MRWWKWVGLAGVVGVAATGVVVARSERRRRAYTPDEVRTRLHSRYAEAASSAQGEAGSGVSASDDPAASGRPGSGWARGAVRGLRRLPRQRSRRDAT